MRSLIAALIISAFSFNASALEPGLCGDFLDVENTSEHCAGITWMGNRGITLGCTADLYCPREFVTREQLATLMARAHAVPQMQLRWFTGNPVPHSAAPAAKLQFRLVKPLTGDGLGYSEWIDVPQQ